MSDKRNNRRRNRKGSNAEDSNGVALAQQRANPRFLNTSFRGKYEVAFPIGMVGIPDLVRTCLKYSEMIAFTASATPSAQVFLINSLFDPNFSGTGHQPSFYDFFQSMYSRYCVLGVSAVLDIENESAVAITCAAVFADTNVGAQTVESLSEAMRCKSAIVGPAGSVNTKRIVMPATAIASIMGQRDLASDPNMYASVGSSPTDNCWFVYKCASTDGSTTVTSRVKFNILFDCIFKDVNPQQASLLAKQRTVKTVR